MSYGIDKALYLCLDRITNIKLRSLLTQAAIGVQEDHEVLPEYKYKMFIKVTAEWVSRFELASYLMNDNELDDFDVLLSDMLEGRTGRYSLIQKYFEFM